MNWYIGVLKRYFDFNGRSRRQEFWMFVLISVAISIVLGIIGGIINTTILSTVYSLAVFLPGIGVGARRLHDTGKSGWWQLIVLTGIGIILLIVFWAQEGTPGDNQYGANPKGA